MTVRREDAWEIEGEGGGGGGGGGELQDNRSRMIILTISGCSE